MVPYLMRKPFEAFIIPHDPNIVHIHDLKDTNVEDLSRSLREVCYSLSLLMPAIKRDFLYDLVFHTGPFGSMFVEVSPHSVVDDARANLRTYRCPGRTIEIANVYRAFFKNFVGDYERGIKREPSPAMIQRVRQECF